MSIAPASLAFQEAHIHDDRSLGLKVTFVISLIISTIAVVLRIISRRISNAPLKADDITIIIALVLWYGLSCINFNHAWRWGLGKHEVSLQAWQLIAFLKGLYAYSLLYTPIIILCKISILLLYHRIFVLTKFQMHVKFWIVFLALFGISTWLVDWFFCWPISYFWNKEQNGKCIDTYRYYMTCAALNVFTDLVILILPIPIVWSLQLPKKQRITLIGIFSLGGDCCLATVFRLVTFPYIDNNDFPWTYTLCSYFTNSLEIPAAFACACLPTMRPLIRKFVPISLSKGSHNNIRKGSPGWSGGSSNIYKDSKQGTWISLEKKNSRRTEMDTIDQAENGTFLPVGASGVAPGNKTAWYTGGRNGSLGEDIPLKPQPVHSLNGGVGDRSSVKVLD